MSRSLIPNSTQIPDVILDEWMPHLSGAELRVVMFIARKTFGWGKTFDRISLTQMQEGTGLARSTVVTTCEGLESRGMLQTAAGEGQKANAYRLNLQWHAEPDCAENAEASCAENTADDCTENRTSPKNGLATSTEIGLVRKSDYPSTEIGLVTSPKIGHTRDTLRNTLQETEDPPVSRKRLAPKGPDGQAAVGSGGTGSRSKATAVRFTPPSLDEAVAYFAELGQADLAAGWHDHFTSNGWKISGRAPMRDWRASCRTWKRLEDAKTGGGRASPRSAARAGLSPEERYARNLAAVTGGSS